MKTILILLVILFILFNRLNSAEYHVDKKEKNLVKFVSETPVEDFDGKTNKIDGYLISDGIEKMQGAELYFEVDLNSVDTGIGLRNRHMREDYLHTDKYPLTHFKGNVIESEKISDSEYNLKVSGKMFIHGVTRDITVSGKLYKLSNGFKLKSDFKIKLTDYKIEVPKFMFVRISEEIKLFLDFIVKLAE
jgi:polyisoprenoid-binding protein YceI